MKLFFRKFQRQDGSVTAATLPDTTLSESLILSPPYEATKEFREIQTYYTELDSNNNYTKSMPLVLARTPSPVMNPHDSASDHFSDLKMSLNKRTQFNGKSSKVHAQIVDPALVPIEVKKRNASIRRHAKIPSWEEQLDCNSKNMKLFPNDSAKLSSAFLAPSNTFLPSYGAASLPDIHFPTFSRPKPRKSAANQNNILTTVEGTITEDSSNIYTSPTVNMFASRTPGSSPRLCLAGNLTSVSLPNVLPEEYLHLLKSDIIRISYQNAEQLPQLIASFMQSNASAFSNRVLLAYSKMNVKILHENFVSLEMTVQKTLWKFLAIRLESLPTTQDVSSPNNDFLSWDVEELAPQALQYKTMKGFKNNFRTSSSFLDYLKNVLDDKIVSKETFFLTYREFISPFDLNRLLITTFCVYKASSFIRKKIVDFYDFWLRTCPFDFWNDYLSLVLWFNFLVVDVNDEVNSSNEMTALLQLTLVQLQAAQYKRQSCGPVVLGIIHPDFPNVQKFCTFSEKKLAIYLSLIQWRKWQQVEIEDWIYPNKSNLLSFIQASDPIEKLITKTLIQDIFQKAGVKTLDFSSVTQNVANQIKKSQKKVFDKWVNVADCCFTLRNYQQTFSIISILQSDSYTKLEHLWTRNTSKILKRLGQQFQENHVMINMVQTAQLRGFISTEQAIEYFEAIEIELPKKLKNGKTGKVFPIQPQLIPMIQEMRSLLKDISSKIPLATKNEDSKDFFPSIHVSLECGKFDISVAEHHARLLIMWASILKNQFWSLEHQTATLGAYSTLFQSRSRRHADLRAYSPFPPHFQLLEETLNRLIVCRLIKDPKMSSMADLHLQGIQLHKIPSLKKILKIHEWFLANSVA